MKQSLLAGISIIALTLSGAVIAEETAPKTNTDMKNNSEMAPAPKSPESKATPPASADAKTTDSKATSPATTTTSEKSTTTAPPTGASSSTATTTTTPSTTTAATPSAGGDVNYATTQNSSDFRSTKVIGLNVYNSKQEKIGDINDLIIGADGAITHAVVGVGGFLGMGEKNVAVPYHSIKMNRDKDGKLTAMIDSTKEALKSAPTFKFFGTSS